MPINWIAAVAVAAIFLSGCGRNEELTETEEVQIIALALLNEIEQLKSQASDAEDKIEELEEQIDLLESNLGVVEEEVADIENRVSTIEILAPL